MLAEMRSVAATEVSRVNHRGEEMRLQKPLWCGQGAGQPAAMGEAAAEQHGVCATRLPWLKTDTRGHREAFRPLPHASRPGSHAEIRAMKRSCACFSLAEVKGN